MTCLRFRTNSKDNARFVLCVGRNVQHCDALTAIHVLLISVEMHLVTAVHSPTPSADMTQPLLNIVLYQPEIPQNTGNIGRTCVAVGARLWMIEPLGFRLEDRYLKRAGMDYWQHLDWDVVSSWQDLRQRLPDASVWYLTKSATRFVWEAAFQVGDILLFGSESRGLPPSILAECPNRRLKLPMHRQVRSLNLASTVNTVAYEAVRQLGGL